MNPYEEALTIIGKTLEVFEEDKEVLCFGFGDGNQSPACFFSEFIIKSYFISYLSLENTEITII